MKLSSGQMEQFERDGYLVLEAAFSLAEVARMRDEADHILELIVNSSLAHGRTSGRLGLSQSSDGSQVVRKIQPINDLSLYLSQVAVDERLIGPLRQLMGDEPVLMEEKLNYKQPLPEPVAGIESTGPETAFEVHSDWAYYRGQGYPQSILSSAIALDTCYSESGPIRVWPGSHTVYLEHRKIDNGLEVVPGAIDPTAAVEILATAGSVMLFHSLLVHNSQSNMSGSPRRLMIYSHYPAAANMGHDVRNSPKRLAEAPWEWEYARTRDTEEPFHAPRSV